MENQSGAVLLSANREGLSIAPILNMTPVKYAWADIARILLTKRLITKELGEKGFSWNQAIVYYRHGNLNEDLHLLKRWKNQVWKSPKGYNISIVDIPREDINKIKEALNRLSSNNTEISSLSSVHFDYVENTERFQI
jgi:hypothetical protein